MEPEPPLTGPLMCSFCARSAGAAGRLVAGPGVAVCAACAETSMRLFSGANGSQAENPWLRMTDEELLAHLPEIAAVASQVEERLRSWVRDRPGKTNQLGAHRRLAGYDQTISVGTLSVSALNTGSCLATRR